MLAINNINYHLYKKELIVRRFLIKAELSAES